MTDQVLYAELRIRVFVPRDSVPDTVDEECPFSDPVDDMKVTISQIEWEGLSYHEGVRIEVTDA